MTPKERELCEDAANFCALHGDPLHAAAIRAALRETRETPAEEKCAICDGPVVDAPGHQACVMIGRSNVAVCGACVAEIAAVPQPMRSLTKQELNRWIDEFERTMFPHQESEFEAEALTSEGRDRVGVAIQKLVRTLTLPPRETRETPAPDGSVMVRVDAAYVEQMRGQGLAGPFSRVQLDERDGVPTLLLTVEPTPTPDTVEYWRAVAQELATEIHKLRGMTAPMETK